MQIAVSKEMQKDGEVFEDNTIVEFKYEMDREKRWRWVPIRVRNDKTTELKQGITLNYGLIIHLFRVIQMKKAFFL